MSDPARSSGTSASRRWRQGRLDRELQGQLETGVALDRNGSQEAAAVELEVAGRVVDRHPGEPVKAQASRSTEGALEEWAADLLAAPHVPAGGHDVRASLRERHHAVDVRRLVRAVRHGDDDVGRGTRRHAGLHRVQHAAAEFVPEQSDGRQLAQDGRDRRAPSGPRRSRRPQGSRGPSRTARSRPRSTGHAPPALRRRPAGRARPRVATDAGGR